jgi:hypothetical protein
MNAMVLKSCYNDDYNLSYVNQDGEIITDKISNTNFFGIFYS